uniref:Uncharacterized protein n=1 Tax=Arundo donax TaxID=35708 RepID=A0A0A9C8Z6_ARUDO
MCDQLSSRYFKEWTETATRAREL